MKGSMVLLIFIALSGCSGKPGRSILEEKKMMNVMWDLIRVDEFATTYVSKDSSLNLKKERFRLYQDVYRINGLNEKTFSDSYKYYADRPDLMKKLFDSLTTRAEQERQLLYKPVDTAAARKMILTDSLKRDSLKSAFLFRDSMRVDSMKKITLATKTRKEKFLTKDSLAKKSNSLKKASGKRRRKQ